MKKIKMSIKTRMMLSILLTSVITFSFTTFFCSSKSKSLIKGKTKELVATQTAEDAKSISAKITDYIATLNTLATAYSNYYSTDEDERQFIVDGISRKISHQNSDLLKLTCDWYGEMETVISEPFLEKLSGKITNSVLTKMSAPIIYNDNPVGLVTANIVVDSLLSDFDDIISDKDQENIYIVTNKGTIAYSKNSKEETINLSQIFPRIYSKYNFEGIIKNGLSEIIECEHNGDDIIISTAPIKINSETNWTLLVTAPRKVMTQAAAISRLSTILLIVSLIILCIATFLLSNRIGKSLKTINNALVDVSDGDIKNDNVLAETPLTEINNINESLKSVISGLIKAAEFSEQIGHGNLNTEFQALSENDKLGNALINMRNNLQKNEEENAKRKIEDEKVNWATLGLAKFGEILHTDNQSINDLTYEILRNLIKYIDVNQGAIYVLDDTKEEPEYEMTAAIAYDRRKFMQKRFAIGEDLVGRCAYEHKTIYMTDIPENYITITSGMGSATASALLLVPLVIEDKVFGIIELASFSKLEDYKINFVEKLAESIASTISTVKVNERTNELLKQSKVQAEELASQEEEMRQNMEELQATQEEAARRDNETNSIMNVINQKLIVVEYDTDGIVTNANAAYTTLTGTPVESLIGQKADEGMVMNAEQKRNYAQMWNNLRNGKTETMTSHLKLNDNDIWLAETYSPITEPLETKPYKIVRIAVNVSEHMVAQNTITELEEEAATKDAKIAALEAQIDSATQPASPKPTKKAAKPAATTDDETEFNAPVGEQPLIEWTDDRLSGNDEFDEQQKQLSNLANSVYTAFKAAKSKKEMKDSLRSLIDFASYHFGTVESFIDQTGYSDKDSFKLAFEYFIAKLESFQKLHAAGKVKSADGLMLFLSNWLKAYSAQLKDLM